jgi:hypothetical protein
MKIAVISDRVYPYFKGGAEKRTWDIASLLTKKGCEFHFYTGQWPGMKRTETSTELDFENHLSLIGDLENYAYKIANGLKENTIRKFC